MRLISFIVLISFSLQVNAFADCDFKTGIKENADGTFNYSLPCHIKVGEMKRDLEIKDLQLEKLSKSIELKDLAIKKSDERADLWMNTSFKLQDRMNTIEEMKSKNNMLYIGIGVGLTALAVWGAGQLR